MKKYTVDELAEIFARNDDSLCYYTEEQKQRALNNPVLETYRNGMKEMYKVYTENLTVALPFKNFKRFFKDGDRRDGEYWYYFNRRKLYAVALMAWLYDEKEYYDELENILWATMDEYVWNIPAHVGPTGMTELQQGNYTIDLFSADVCHGIAEILVLVGDKLEPIISKRAERLINERCFDMFVKPFWWKTCHHNWAAVCAGEVGMTAIYMKKDPTELAKIIHSCLDTMEHYLSGFPADGACTEGLGYWGYGFGYYTYFGELLYRRTHGEINIFDDEKVRKIANFPRKCFFKGGKVVTFSDCGGSDTSKFTLPLTAKLAEFFPEIELPEKELVNLDFQRGGSTSFALPFRMLIWSPESLDGCTLKPQTFLLPDAQWYISSSENGMGVAAKAGYNWEGVETHNHNDVGNFIIYKNNANLISDIGAGVYTGTYFNHEYRYNNFACSSRGHNLPIINGEYQKYGEKFRAKGTMMSEEGGITSDIAGAYDVPSLEGLVRNVRLDKTENRVYLTDSYKFKTKPESVVERFISYNEPKLEDGEVTISANGETLTFGYDKNAVKPVLRVFEDTDEKNRVRHADGFKAYIIDFEVVEPTEEFTLRFTME